MTRRKTNASVLAGVLALSVALSACGRDSDDGEGVTENEDGGGVIYLGTITDLTGPFAGVGEPFTAGQAAFWEQVNADGGLEGGWEVNVTDYVKDSGYDVTAHSEAFNEIKDDVLAISQSLGTAHTNSFLEDATEEKMIVGPASLGSNWIFDEAAIQVGTSYCAEGMNVIDYAVDQGAKSVAVVHLPGDYGDDSMVGARIAAEANDIKFTAIETGSVAGGDDQSAAIGALLRAAPDLVYVATSPQELATIVGGAAAQDFKKPFIGSIPTWNTALLDSPAAPALEALYMQASSFPTWDSEEPGMAKMREAAGEQAPNDWFSLGFSSGYLMKAILEKAIEDGEVNREGIYDAAQSLEGIDSEGTLPEGTGNFAADPNEEAIRVTQLNKVDQDASSKVSVAVEPFTGSTAEGYDFTEPCYELK